MYTEPCEVKTWDDISPKWACSQSRDLFKCWEISNISATVKDRDVITTGTIVSGIRPAIAAIKMTLSVLEDHSPIASLFKLSVIFWIYGMSCSLSASAELLVYTDVALI